MTHWRDTCRIKSFVIPYDLNKFNNTLRQTFRTIQGYSTDVYDCTAVQYLDFMPIKAKYERRT